MQIDSHIPVPERAKPLTHVLRDLQVTQSFLANPDQIPSIRTTASVLKIKITKFPEGDKIRIWRIA